MARRDYNRRLRKTCSPMEMWGSVRRRGTWCQIVNRKRLPWSPGRCSCENLLLLLLFQLHLEVCDLVSEVEKIRMREEEQKEVGPRTGVLLTSLLG